MSHLVQVAARATDLDSPRGSGRSCWVVRPPRRSIPRPGVLRSRRGAGLPTETEPHLIFTHEDDTTGPAGTEEWMAFVKDPGGNLVGLVEHRPVT